MKVFIFLGAAILFLILCFTAKTLWKGDSGKKKDDFNPNADDHTNAQY